MTALRGVLGEVGLDRNVAEAREAMLQQALGEVGEVHFPGLAVCAPVPRLIQAAPETLR